MQGDREQCLAAGMDDYLSKPFGRKQLGRILEQWLPEQGKQVSAAHTAPRLAAVMTQASPPHAVDEPVVLDRHALANVRAVQRHGKPDVLHKLIGIYFDSTPQLLQALGDAIAAGDPAAMQKAAHSLKSSSASLGAQRLAELCKDLETMGRNNTTDEATDLLLEIEGEYRVACDALEMERAGKAA